MNQIEHVLTDKGSKYAVNGSSVKSKPDVLRLIKQLKSKKKYAKATHNTWAVVFSDGTQYKDDDGESGAGAMMLEILNREEFVDHVVVVTRWYGGVHLGHDRFRHVKTCVKSYLDLFQKS